MTFQITGAYFHVVWGTVLPLTHMTVNVHLKSEPTVQAALDEPPHGRQYGGAWGGDPGRLLTGRLCPEPSGPCASRSMSLLFLKSFPQGIPLADKDSLGTGVISGIPSGGGVWVSSPGHRLSPEHVCLDSTRCGVRGPRRPFQQEEEPRPAVTTEGPAFEFSTRTRTPVSREGKQGTWAWGCRWEFSPPHFSPAFQLRGTALGVSFLPFVFCEDEIRRCRMAGMLGG